MFQEWLKSDVSVGPLGKIPHMLSVSVDVQVWQFHSCLSN